MACSGAAVGEMRHQAVGYAGDRRSAARDFGVQFNPLGEALRDRYRIERELGRGGMAVVYLARDLRHERRVALKVILPDSAGAVGAGRFRREIRVTAALQHPNILPVFDSGITAGYSWYTMPYVAEESLRRRLDREGALPVSGAIALAREVADALAYAHAQGVVHRDIKPENILISGGHALVSDFGVARVLGPVDAGLTLAGSAVGSPAYMSPEQVAGDQVDGRSDVYALGCVLFEMLTGRPPFSGVSALATMSRRLVESAPDVRSLRPDVPDTVESAVRRALARDPGDRFGGAAELASALAGPIPDGSAPAPRPAARPVPHEPRLVEREEFLDDLDRLLVAAVAGRGGMVVVSGEAGIGKTSLVEEFTRDQRAVRLLWGWCEALFTPRPLGPLYDIAAQLGGALDASLRTSGNREAVFAAVLEELGPGRPPTVLVLEDVHWADEATLDLLKFLGRRAPRLPLLVVVTVRDDEIGPTHRLRSVIGDLPSGSVHRVQLPPLSGGAVAALARRAGRSHRDLHAVTGGNPFYVSEVLATSHPGIPPTVRDAVLSRASRVSAAARETLEVVSVVPGKVEPWLVERLFGPDSPAVEECLAAGMLTSDAQGLGFRHELARHAVEESVQAGRRRALHARVLAAIAAAAAPVAPARLVHHAEAAGDLESLQRYLPLAAAQASALGAHREAAAHYEAGLRMTEAMSEETRVALLEGLSSENYMIDRMPGAIEARRQALEIWRRLGDRRREGATLRWLSRLAWSSGQRRDAERYAHDAVAVLEPLGAGPELARAYSNLSQLHMLAFDRARTVEWGTRAIALAEQLTDGEILIHALTNVGTAELSGSLSPQQGREQLERALRLAKEAGFQEHISRCYACLVASEVGGLDHGAAERWLREGLAYTEPRDLDFWSTYLRSWQAQLLLYRGAWEEAARETDELLALSVISPVSRITALCVRGSLLARRGELGAMDLLDEARMLAERTEELQRLGPVALARAEAAWLAGDEAGVVREARGAYELSLTKDNPWIQGPLAVWLHRAGALSQAPGGIPRPSALALGGDARATAAEWSAIGCPYEQGLALARSDDSDALAEGIHILENLGALAAVRAVSRPGR